MAEKTRTVVMRFVLAGEDQSAGKAFESVQQEVDKTGKKLTDTEKKAKRTQEAFDSFSLKSVFGELATGKLEGLFGSRFGGDSTRVLGALGTAFKKSRADVDADGNAILSTLGEVDAGFASLGPAGIAAAAGVAAVAGAFVVAAASFQEFFSYAKEIDTIKKITNTSTEQAAALVVVGQNFGITTKNLIDGIREFGDRILFQEALINRFGVTIKRNADGTADAVTTFFDLIATLRDIPDAFDKIALSSALFGEESSRELLQLQNLSKAELELLQEQAKRKGLILSDNDIQEVKKLELAFNEVKVNIKAVAVTVGKELLPVIVGTAVTAKVVSDQIAIWGSRLGEAVDLAGAFFSLVTNVDLGGIGDFGGELDKKFGLPSFQEEYNRTMDELNARIDDFSKGIDGASASFDTFADKLASARGLFDEAFLSEDTVNRTKQAFESAVADVENASVAFAKAQKDFADAQRDAARSVDNANEKLADSYRSLAEANQAANDARADGAKEAERFEIDAAKRIQDATEALTDAQVSGAERVADARKRLLEVTEDLAKVERDAAEREQDARLDALEIQDKNPFQARDKIAKAELDNAERIAEAKKRITEAQDNVKDAETDSAKSITDAQERLSEVLEDNAQARIDLSERISKAIERADEAVVKAHKGVNDATRSLYETMETAAERVQDAEQRMNESGIKLGEFQSKVEDLAGKTFDYAYAVALAGGSTKDVGIIVERAGTAVKTAGDKFKFSADQADLFYRKLELIKRLSEGRVTTNTTNPLAAIAAEAARRAAATIRIPQFHSGGQFRTQSAGGEGLALLKDREYVIPEDKLPSAARPQSSVQVVVNGSVVTERELVSTIRRVVKEILP
jgi:hypothetical protein